MHELFGDDYGDEYDDSSFLISEVASVRRDFFFFHSAYSLIILHVVSDLFGRAMKCCAACARKETGSQPEKKMEFRQKEQQKKTFIKLESYTFCGSSFNEEPNFCCAPKQASLIAHAYQCIPWEPHSATVKCSEYRLSSAGRLDEYEHLNTVKVICKIVNRRVALTMMLRTFRVDAEYFDLFDQINTTMNWNAFHLLLLWLLSWNGCTFLIFELWARLYCSPLVMIWHVTTPFHHTHTHSFVNYF